MQYTLFNQTYTLHLQPQKHPQVIMVEVCGGPCNRHIVVLYYDKYSTPASNRLSGVVNYTCVHPGNTHCWSVGTRPLAKWSAFLKFRLSLYRQLLLLYVSTFENSISVLVRKQLTVQPSDSADQSPTMTMQCIPPYPHSFFRKLNFRTALRDIPSSDSSLVLAMFTTVTHVRYVFYPCT